MGAGWMGGAARLAYTLAKRSMGATQLSPGAAMGSGAKPCV